VFPLAMGLTAVALAAGGLGAFLEAGAVHSDAVARSERGTLSDGSGDSLKNAVRAWDWVAVGAWVGAAAAGTIAVVTFVRSQPGAAQSAQVVAGPASIGVEGSF
jgi:hypothetical protein